MKEEELEDYRWSHMSFDFYKEPKNKDEWLECPECKLKPRVWEFNNGRFAHCVCGNNRYDHKHKVSAKSIVSVCLENNGNVSKYDVNELRDNWNNYINKIC